MTGVVEIIPSTSATPQANEIYGWESLGIVAGGAQMRRHSLGGDRLEVWICNVGGPYSLTPNQAANKLDNELGPYFDSVSEGRYQPNFAAGGTLNGSSSSDCLGGINQTSNANGVIVVENGYVGSALGGPGLLCNAGGSCPEAPDTFPANSRYVLAGAETVNDGAAQDNGFTSALVSVIAHEVGHSLNFPHSYSGQTFVSGQLWEYDNPTDNMSGNLTNGERLAERDSRRALPVDGLQPLRSRMAQPRRRDGLPRGSPLDQGLQGWEQRPATHRAPPRRPGLLRGARDQAPEHVRPGARAGDGAPGAHR